MKLAVTSSPLKIIASAMRIVTTESVDLILLDFKLANGERGDLLADEIRATSPKIPIVMFTDDNPSPENARQSVNAVIKKPENDACPFLDIIAKFVPDIPLHPRGSDAFPKESIPKAS